MRPTTTLLHAASLGLGLLALAACGAAPPAHFRVVGAGNGGERVAAEDGAVGDVFPVPAPPFSAGIFPCSRCHAGGAEPADNRPAFAHASHVARGLECADCHATDGAADSGRTPGEPELPSAETCQECHDDPSADSDAARAYFDAVRQDDGSLAFTRRWVTRDTRPAHASHAAAGVDCTACHGEVTDGAFAKPRSVPLMERCVTCHEQRAADGAPSECAACHSEIRDPQHANVVLHHAEEQRGCLDCHSRTDRDVLHLANGTPVPFEQSYRLCGQCHGPKLRDWKLGLHGKRTGHWDGRREYLLCAHCHDPHSPRFPLMVPLAPPYRPEEVR
jgi:hypothetical protein